MDQIELIEKRKPREKHFLQKDGTIRAEVYGEDVHYLKEGKYEEIDNTLIERDDLFVNANNDFHVEYSQDSLKSLMKITKNNHFINIRIKNSEKLKMHKGTSRISKENKNILLNNINDDILIKYQTFSRKVKETIVLKTRNCSIPSFEIDTDLLLQEKDGFIIALDNNKKEVFRLEKPYMMDSNGETNYNVYYIIKDLKSSYYLDLVLDQDWIMNDNRQYPIYIDPTISTDSTNSMLYDTYIFPGDTNVDRNNQDILKAGVEHINNTNVENRTLIKFDLPDIGTGSEVIQAELELVNYLPSVDHSSAGAKLVSIHRITESWDESNATWNQMNDKYDSKVEAIAQCYRSSLDNNNIIACHMGADITSLVKGWYKDTDNYGLMIQSIDKNYIDADYPAFFSKNNNIGGSNPKPKLYVVYRNQNGLEKYLDYKEVSFSGGKSYINTYNGNLTLLYHLIRTVGKRGSVILNLIYNSNDAVVNNNTYFGYGYKLNLEQFIEIIDNDKIMYTDDSGAIHYLNKGSNGYNLNLDANTFYDEDGLNIKVTNENQKFIMYDEYNNRKEFSFCNNKYQLTKLIDSDNNETTIILDNDFSIKKIVDCCQNEINVYYNQNNIRFTSSACDTYLYYSNGLLSSIQSIVGTINITYNSNGLIQNITDYSGLRLGYTYYEKAPYKLKKVSEYGLDDSIGKTFEFVYGYDNTTIIDNDNKSEILQYNYMGNMISKNNLASVDDIVTAYSFENNYGDGNSINKVTSSVIPYRYVKNYLKNTSFETDTDYFIAESDVSLQYDNTYCNSGLRSLKAISNFANRSFLYSIEIEKNNYYTFSGYFKNNNNVSISLGYYDTNNNYIEEKSEFGENTDFTRQDVTIFYPNESIGNLQLKITFETSGIIYIDDIQLEKGEVANYYNYLENSDFSEGLTDWDVFLGNGVNDENDYSNYNINDFIDVVSINSNNDKALRVHMNPIILTGFRKKFNIKGKMNDLYTLSFWYKNDAVSPYLPDGGSNITILYEPYDDQFGHCVLLTALPKTYGKWQHYIYREKAIEDFKSITIIFNQIGQANDFFVTNMSFYKNVTGGQYNYDEYGNLVSYTNESGNTDLIEYDNNNQIIKVTNPLNNSCDFEYSNENKGRIINTFNKNLCNRQYYDNYGNTIRTSLSSKNVTELNNGCYRIRKKGTYKYIKAELNIVLLEENDCSNTKWLFTKVGDKYKISYCSLDNYYLSIEDNTLILSNTSENNLFSIIKNDDNSYKIHFIVDTLNYSDDKVLKDSNDVLIFESYQGNNNEYDFYIEQTDSNFIENNTKYDSNGNHLMKEVDSNFNETSYTCNSTTGMIESITNPNNVITNFYYNNKNQLSSISCSGHEVLYTYNSSNKVNKINTAGKEYNISYDEFLRTIGVKLGNNTNFTSNIYDNSGNIVRTNYANGDYITFDYDEFNRISKISKMDNVYNYKYDNNGGLSKIVSNRDITRFYYDISSRLYKYRKGDFVVNNFFDSNDNIVGKTIKYNHLNKQVACQYDLNENLTQISFDNNFVSYTYDSLNRVSQRNINNLIINNYYYISNGKRTSNVISKHSINNDNYSYEYDNMYNILNIYKNNILIKHYEYDDLNELISEINYDTETKIFYIYDMAGNIIKKTTKTLNDVIVDEVTYLYDNNYSDQMISSNNESMEYDEYGNLTRIGSSVLNWTNGSSLESYVDNVRNISVSYEYDINNNRTKKIINNQETEFLTINGKIFFEDRNGDIIYYLYDGDDVVGLEYNNLKYFYLKNIKNDVIGIVDSNGSLIVKYEYDSWGNILSIKDQNNNDITSHTNIGLINPFRYRSYYYDNETNLYYLKSRYYNPVIGRFISPDVFMGINLDVLSYNLYLYVGNNPVNYVDTSGKGFMDLITGIGNAISNLLTGKSKKKTNSKSKNKVKTVKKEKNIVEKIVDSKKSFVAEYWGGVGIGDKLEVGPFGDGLVARKAAGQGYRLQLDGSSPGEKYMFVNQEITAQKGIGVTAGMRNEDPRMNFMAFTWDYLNNDKTDYYIEGSYFGNKSRFGGSANDEGTIFIGLSFEGYYVAGGGFKLGLELDL